MTRLHYVVLAAPWLLLAVYVVLGLATEPDPRGYGTHEQLGLGVCLFRDWLGGPCPTCGVTTSGSHLAHGDVAAAWSTQPLGVVLAVFALTGLPATFAAHRRGLDLGVAALRHGGKLWMTVSVLVAACWLLG